MAFRSTAEEMERLQLSDEDTEELWNSPSKRGNKKLKQNIADEDARATPEPRPSHDNGETLFDRQDAREAALRNELQSVRNINQVIESLLTSLDRAKGNMDNVSQTVQSASTLLNTWTRILSQTEHNQRLILNPNWQGAVQDVADIESETIAKQQAAERREQDLQRQRQAARRKAEEDEKKRAQPKSTRGTSRGRVVRSTGLGRTPSVSYSGTSSGASRTAATRGSSTTTTSRRPISGALGAARGSGIARGGSSSRT